MALFSKSEREKLFSDAIGLISTYFRSSEKDLKTYQIKLDKDYIGQDEFSNFEKTLRLLFLISSIDKFKKIIFKIERRPSKESKKVIKDFPGEIRGNLNINKHMEKYYIKQTPKIYPCDIYVNDYFLPENILLSYMLISLYNELLNFDLPDGTIQKKIIDKTLEFLHRKMYNPIFKSNMKAAMKIYELSNPKHEIDNIINKINNRYRNHLIYNDSYGKLIDFYKEYNKRNFVQLYNSNTTLMLYDESFDDKLYEIWLLNSIINCFKENYDFRIKSKNISLQKRLEGPIIEFIVPNEKLIKIYFQKSNGLVWGKNIHLDKILDTTWSKYNNGGENDRLKGNLDIIITYDDAKKFPPILIDAKNIIYGNNKYVSENIYKMIGHLDNFRQFTDIYNGRRGILIFRNNREHRTKQGFEELYTAKDGATIAVFSVNPFVNSCNNMIIEICDYILREIGYLNGALKIKRDFDIKLGEGDLLYELNNAKESGDEEKENKIAVEIHEILSHTVYYRFKGNENIKEYYNILKENYFGEFWDKLTSEEKDFLAIAEFLYNKVELIENSSAGVMYSKFIEKLANGLIIKPFFKYLSGQDLSIMCQYNNWKSLFNRSKMKKTISLEIGKIAWELKDVNKNIRVRNDYFNEAKAEFSIFINLLMDIKGRYKIKDDKWIFWYDNIKIDEPKTKRINELGELLYRFSKIRNKIAHIDKVNRNDLVLCRRKVLGIGGEKSIAMELLMIFPRD